ncbi:hypothetical protein EVAR_31005_1 [Eumeta japonica]|uniref:Uncharacterized protein n=1 Tax=Eumeta variegata TaxID=151549 RepID=A0A4C1VFF3_EUMVA|nr:hypothetical protein EVAR_31005_1 [Eumeta japonica]
MQDRVTNTFQHLRNSCNEDPTLLPRLHAESLRRANVCERLGGGHFEPYLIRPGRFEAADSAPEAAALEVLFKWDAANTWRSRLGSALIARGLMLIHQRSQNQGRKLGYYRFAPKVSAKPEFVVL